MSEHHHHVLQVGDLCRRHDHDGIVYRILDIDGTTLFIKPVLYLIGRNKWRTHETNTGNVTYMSLTDLGAERLKFDNFLLEEARKHGDG